MVTLHHLNNSRSQRILWLLEELEINYQIKHYTRNRETQLAPDELKIIHPLGKSPVITDGEIVIAESAVIIDYLVQNYAQAWVLPEANSEQFWQLHYWMHFSEGSLMPPLLLRLIFEKIKTSPMPFFVKPIAKGIANKVLNSFVKPNISSNLNYIEKYLQDREWFIGNTLSAADIQMSFPLEACVARGITENKHANINAYVKRLQARPAYKKALKEAGDYAYA